MATAKQQQAEQLKQQGNECVRAGNYTEAIVHYTHALGFDSNNHLIYSNRSLAFLKADQYYLALEDAKQAIKLQPSWPKGYFRKGEVEFKTGHFSSAYLSYGQALLLGPTSPEVQEAITKTGTELKKLKRRMVQEPWIFCGGGAVLGLLIVLADQFLAKKPSIQYIVLQLMLVVTFSGLGYVCLKIYKYLRDSHIKSLLEPPVDLLESMNGPSASKSNKKEEKEEKETVKQTESKPHRKGGISAARQRYKKGKA